MRLLKILAFKLNLLALLGLAVLLLLFGAGVSLGYLVEDLQEMLFVFVLLCFWFLPKKTEWRIPRGLVFVVLVFWFLSYLPQLFELRVGSEGAALSRLQGDRSGLTARALYQRFNQISKVYRLPPIRLVQMSLSEDQSARQWLAKYSRTPFLIYGDEEKLRVVFSPEAESYRRDYGSSLAYSEIPNRIKEEANSLNLDLSNLLIVKNRSFASPLAVVFAPEALTVPAQPTELSRHLLAWIGKGLELPREGATPSEASREARSAAFLEASFIMGDWQESEPLGLTSYLWGTARLLQALESPVVQSGENRIAFRKLSIAMKKTSREKAPELWAAIYNNAAVSLMVDGASPRDLARASRWLSRAAKTRDAEDQLVVGAKAAYLNLISLKEFLGNQQ